MGLWLDSPRNDSVKKLIKSTTQGFQGAILLRCPKLRWWQVIAIGFLTTVCIEVGQLITKLGMFDLDDILNNMIGLGIGMVLSRKVKRK